MKSFILTNGEEVVIKEAVKEDASIMLEYLYKISVESDFLTFGRDEVIKSVEDEEEFIEENAKADNRLSLVAKINGKMVGGLNFVGGSKRRTKHIGEFGVSVLKEYWGFGIGRQLIGYLTDWAERSGGIRKINLRVRSDNERAASLYTRLGFKKEGLITRDFYIDGQFYDSILMGLQID